MVKTILCDSWGYYAEVYADNDHDSGYGDNPRVGRWYGTRAECEALDPAVVKLHPLAPDAGIDSFDLACERRHDA